MVSPLAIAAAMISPNGLYDSNALFNHDKGNSEVRKLIHQYFEGESEENLASYHMLYVHFRNKTGEFFSSPKRICYGVMKNLASNDVNDDWQKVTHLILYAVYLES